MNDQKITNIQLPTINSLIDLRENRLTRHTEIKILKKITVTEDLTDSRENRLTPHTEIKILVELIILEESKIKTHSHIRKVLPKL